VLAIGALVPVLLALGTHFPLYSTLWHHLPPLRYPRVPERQLPVTCLALAALAAFAVARLRWVLVAALLILVVADLRVSIYQAAAADPGTRAYERLSAPGRLLELPVLHPNVHLGSVYLWYDQVAQRERPGGYSTIAPQSAAQLSLRLAELNCGDWRPGDAALLRRLGVRYVAFHRGLAGRTGWFAWRELLEQGFGQVARDDGVTMLEAGRRGGSSPVAPPGKRVVFCQGWKGGSPRYRHAAFWANGQVRVHLTSREPVRVTLSIKGRLVHSLRLTKPVSIRIARAGWWLVGVDVTRADRGLRVTVTR